MGNILRCFAGPRTNTEIKSTDKRIDGMTDKFDDHLQEVERQNYYTKNNLELYLNDVYEQECVMKAEKEEIEFIKKGIETLVQRIVHLALEDFSVNKKIENLLLNYNNKEVKELQKSLVEVYFPIKCRLKEISDVKTSKRSIIKVGSFYEETKNYFPDEFDFIFLLFNAKQKPDLDVDVNTDGIARAVIRSVTESNKENLWYISHNENRQKRRLLRFDGYVDEHGPASMLQFIYSNNVSGKERCIYVDLVPAYMIEESNREWYDEYVNEHVKPRSFRDEVLSVGKCLYVSDRITFTETEVHFMRNVLSKKHVKVYRILKYLINGHGDGDIYGQYLKEQMVFIACYSTYKIKTMMIYHHDECINPDTENVGPCVLQVLENMGKYDNTDDFPKLYQSFFLGLLPAEKFCLLPNLLTLTQTLRSLQISKDSYKYKNTRMKSVLRQHIDALDRNDSRNVTWFKYLDTLGGDAPSHASLMDYLTAEKLNRLTNIRNVYRKTKACKIL
ncbi:uncharacterized protein LOC128549068 [Mercenaria mercenaria]|uniref:uncharacterized protein LOC128549068 n=1 Tax=Mercenaria mercenaria TaxID=6596 RepID=UPI00234F2E52|nr:uncharacterized protein LOC128549068 [Mercenaria mercenaria]